MPDSNPKLTLQLHNTREALLAERTDIFRRVQALQAELEINSTQIEATDTLMLRFNPEHVALDVRSDADVAPMVVVGRHTLQLASSVADAAVEKPGKTADAERKAVAPRKKKTTGKKKLVDKKLSVKEQIAAVDAALGAKSERSPTSQAISVYFRNSGRNDTILKILESKKEPVNAASVARDYKALYPLPEDSAAMRTMHASRISAALHYLKARGQAIRVADERTDGKDGETNVRWELSKSYRSALRKSRKAGRSQLNGHAVPGAEAADEVRIAVGAH